MAEQPYHAQCGACGHWNVTHDDGAGRCGNGVSLPRTTARPSVLPRTQASVPEPRIARERRRRLKFEGRQPIDRR